MQRYHSRRYPLQLGGLPCLASAECIVYVVALYLHALCPPLRRMDDDGDAGKQAGRRPRTRKSVDWNKLLSCR